MSKSKSSGVSFTGLLFLLFLGLKLTNQIDWSWWWVTAPLWGPIVIVLGFVLIVILIVFLILGMALLFGKKVNIKEVLSGFNNTINNYK